MEGLVEGRIVHFVITENEHRAAIIVNAWQGKLGEGKVNLQVFLDGVNDYRLAERECLSNKSGYESVFKYAPKLANSKTTQMTLNEELDLPMQIWVTSVRYSESKEIGTWHWPEKEADYGFEK